MSVCNTAQLFQNLNFDQTMVEDMLAKAYLEKHEGCFYKGVMTDELKLNEHDYILDSYGNKFFNDDNFTNTAKKEHCEDLEIKLKCMATKLIENTDLFAQLECLIRNVPQVDVKKYDIIMMTERFSYYSLTADTKREPKMDVGTVVMSNESPLCTLGFAAIVLAHGMPLRIITEPETAVISTLFTELLVEAGINKQLVSLDYVKRNSELLSVDRYFGEKCVFAHSLSAGAGAGTLAAVTEHADVHSAVSTLLAATVTRVYPWRLKKIFVQENIYQRFQKVLAHKVALETPNGDIEKQIENLKAKCAATYFYKDKIIVFDYASLLDLSSLVPVVFVEAYRTTKELLTLLHVKECNYLSLWCNQTSTANEIAFGATAMNVWVNDFEIFKGPKLIAESFYAGYDSERLTLKVYDNKLSDVFEKDVQATKNMLIDWSKLNTEKRKQVIVDALKKYQQSRASDEDNFVIELETAMRAWEPYSNVTVQNNKLCLQLNQPVGFITIEDFDYNSYLKLIQSIANGNVALVDFEPLLDFLSKEGVPIVKSQVVKSLERFIFNNNHKDVDLALQFLGDWNILYKPKVIWSSHGESFAN